MPSEVYVTFIHSPTKYTIPIEGLSISLKDLRDAIQIYCGIKSNNYEVHIFDKEGRDYTNEDDLIPHLSNLVARRLPRAKNKIYIGKPKPHGLPPSCYVCNKCHQGGHWIHECPGLCDKDGRILDFKTVKRPTGIPQAFLLEVAPGTPGAYLTKEGKYMVPLKDAEAYVRTKKNNPPNVVKEEIQHDNILESKTQSNFQCPLCFANVDKPTCVPCCSSILCFNLVQQQMMSNNSMDPLHRVLEQQPQWSSVNTPVFNNLAQPTSTIGIPLTIDPVSSNWQQGDSSDVTKQSLPLSNQSTILSKEEFYDLQKKLRAKKVKYRSRSPSPSSSSRSPIRYRKSKVDDDYHSRRKRKRSPKREEKKRGREYSSSDSRRKYCKEREHRDRSSYDSRHYSKQSSNHKSRKSSDYISDCFT